MRVIRMYEANDGKQYASIEEARQADRFQQVKHAIHEAYDVSLGTNRADSFLIAIMHDPVAMRDALNKLIRSAPKGEPEARQAA